MRHNGPQPAQFRIGAIELVVFAGAVSALGARILYAIDTARDRSHVPLLFPALSYEHGPLYCVTWAAVVSLGITSLLITVARRPLARVLGARIAWTFSLTQYVSAWRSITPYRPALFTWLLAIAGLLAWLVVGSNQVVDRADGRTRITWSGPLQDHILALSIIGSLLLAAALAYGIRVGDRSQGLSKLLFLGAVLLAIAAINIPFFLWLSPGD